MSSDVIPNWDVIIHKNAITSEMEEEVTGSVEEKREGRQKSSGGRNPSATQK
jgi:hypothetical protein